MSRKTLNQKLKSKIGFGYLDIAMMILLIALVIDMLNTLIYHRFRFNLNFFINSVWILLICFALIRNFKANKRQH
jgi:phage-related holin